MNTAAKKKDAAILAVKDRAQRDALEFFHDSLRRPWATVPAGDHRETWSIESRDFELWVTNVFLDMYGSAPHAWVKEAIYEFETLAICKGPEIEVFVRVAEQDGKIYIDLADKHWQQVEAGADGWKVTSDSPIKFTRAVGMKPLPYPVRGGDPREITRFMNVKPKHEVLLLTWLTYSMLPRGPYPVVSISGGQGSGKSTLGRVPKALIDPAGDSTRPEVTAAPLTCPLFLVQS